MLCSVERMPLCLGPEVVGSRLAMNDSIFQKTNESSSVCEGGAQQGLRSGFMQASVQVSVISNAGLACVSVRRTWFYLKHWYRNTG